MTAPPTLVVGAGQAGISLVAQLRALGDDGPVVLVGDEDEAPYERPPLSKTYLRGEHDRPSLTLHDAAWFTEHGVELVTGDAVVLAAALRESRDVVVVGGGFIGLEVAASARRMGATITVVEAADRLLARSVTPVLSDFYLAAHERRGTRVLLGT